jgi:OOP family OmpA-OmpF porin
VAGAGYMAPLTSNQTPAGREANRRVEVVLIPR